MLTPAFADSTEITAALCMRIGARHMSRIKPIATGDIAPSDNWWAGPAYGHYGSGQPGLAIGDISKFSPQIDRIFPGELGEALNPFFCSQDRNLFYITEFSLLTLSLLKASGHQSQGKGSYSKPYTPNWFFENHIPNLQP